MPCKEGSGDKANRNPNLANKKDRAQQFIAFCGQKTLLNWRQKGRMGERKKRERKKKGERAREAKAGLLFQREFEREGDEKEREREREEQSM